MFFNLIIGIALVQAYDLGTYWFCAVLGTWLIDAIYDAKFSSRAEEARPE